MGAYLASVSLHKHYARAGPVPCLSVTNDVARSVCGAIAVLLVFVVMMLSKSKNRDTMLHMV